MTSHYEIPYATPQPNGPRVLAATMILFAGLGLVVLGGCFLIGILLMVTGGFVVGATPPATTTASIMLMATLYLLAFTSFAASIALMVLGLRGLLRVIYG